MTNARYTNAATGVDRALIAELGTCRYLETATNVLLIGPPGVGKAHLSVGLARAAAHAGYRTYFTSAADLAARCDRAALEGRWATTMRFHAGSTLLVIDELGYLPLPAACCGRVGVGHDHLGVARYATGRSRSPS